MIVIIIKNSVYNCKIVILEPGASVSYATFCGSITNFGKFFDLGKKINNRNNIIALQKFQHIALT